MIDQEELFSSAFVKNPLRMMVDVAEEVLLIIELSAAVAGSLASLSSFSSFDRDVYVFRTSIYPFLPIWSPSTQ